MEDLSAPGEYHIQRGMISQLEGTSSHKASYLNHLGETNSPMKIVVQPLLLVLAE